MRVSPTLGSLCKSIWYWTERRSSLLSLLTKKRGIVEMHLSERALQRTCWASKSCWKQDSCAERQDEHDKKLFWHAADAAWAQQLQYLQWRSCSSCCGWYRHHLIISQKNIPTGVWQNCPYATWFKSKSSYTFSRRDGGTRWHVVQIEFNRAHIDAQYAFVHVWGTSSWLSASIIVVI